MKKLLLPTTLTLAITACGADPETSKRNNAKVYCAIAAEKLGKYPSKSKNNYRSQTTYTGKGVDDVYVEGIIDLMNGFGAMIPTKYGCNYNHKTKAASAKLVTDF